MAKRRTPRPGRTHVDDTPLEFDAFDGGEPPLSQSLAIGNAGAKGSLLRYTVSVDADWLVVRPDAGQLKAGDPDDVVNVGVNAAGLTPDAYEATIAVTNDDDPDDKAELVVTLMVFESYGDFLFGAFSSSSSSSSSGCQPGPLRECREYTFQCPSPPFLGWPTDCAAPSEFDVLPAIGGMKWMEPRQHSIHNECEPCEWTMCPRMSPTGEVIYSSGGTGAPDVVDASSAIGRAAEIARILRRTALPSLSGLEGARDCGSMTGPCRLNMATGNIVFQVRLPDTGPFGPRLILSYHGKAEEPSEFGYGWFMMYHAWIDEPCDGELGAYVHKGTGVIYNYLPVVGNSYWEPPPGAPNSLKPNGDGTWTERQPDGFSLKYATNGYLQTMQNLAGDVWTVTRDVQNRVTNLADPFGRLTTFTYDSNGFLDTIIDHAGRQTAFDVDGNADLVKITTPELCISSLAYDGLHRLTSWTDPEGNTTGYGYDSQRRVTSITAPTSEKWTIAYDDIELKTIVTNPRSCTTTLTLEQQGEAMLLRGVHTAENIRTTYTWDDGRLTGYMDGRGNTVSFTYEALDDLTHALASVVEPIGGAFTFGYDSSDRVESLIDQNGNRSTLVWDGSGMRTALVNTEGGRTTYGYTSHGQIDEIINPLGKVFERAFDGVGNRESQTNPESERTTLSYDAAGQVTGVENPLGNKTTLTRDDMNRLLSVEDPQGHTTSVEYNLNGYVTKITDPLNCVTTRTYDERNRLETIVDPVGCTTTFQYDGESNLIARTDPLGRTTSFAYDCDNRQTAATDAEGHTTSFSYDDSNNQITRTNPLGHIWTSTFDADNRLESQTDPLGNTTTYSYDNAGNQTERTDALGNVWSSTYDSLLRLETTIDPQGNVTTYGYDAASRQTTVINPLGEVTTTAYDDANRPEAVTDPRGKTTTTMYDAASRPTESINPLGQMTTTVYDEANRAIVVIDPKGNRTTTVYDAANRPTETIDALGHTSTTVYDCRGLVINTIDAVGCKTTFEYDCARQQTAVINPLGEATSSTYTPDGQLETTTTPPNAQGGARLTTTYTYDEANQRTAVTNPAGEITTSVFYENGWFQATTDPRGLRTTSMYDAVGQLITRISAAGERFTNRYSASGQTTATSIPRGAIPNTIGHWWLDEGTGTTAADSSGDNHPGTLQGNTAWVAGPTKALGTALSFDGAGDFVTMGNVLDQTGTDPFSLSIWLQTDQADGALVAKQQSAGNFAGYHLRLVGGKIEATVCANQTAARASVRTVSMYNDDQWHSVILTYDGSKTAAGLKIYVNGLIASTTVESDNFTTGSAANAAPFNLAARSGTDLFLDGLLANARMFDRVLTAEEITALSQNPPNARTTTNAYNAAGRPIAVANPLGFTVTTTYYPGGLVQTTIAPPSSFSGPPNITTRSYDDAGRLIGVTNPLGETVTTTYDANGLVETTVTPSGLVSTNVYDAANRLVQQFAPPGETTTSTYYDDNLLESTTDPRGCTTTYLYDCAKRQTGMIDALGYRTTTTYYENGQVRGQIDQLGLLTSFTYDEAGRQISVTNPEGKTTSSTYLPGGLLEATIDPLGNRTTSTYDDANRLEATTDANGHVTTNTYLPGGLLETVTDAKGCVTTNSYNDASQLTAVEDPLGNVTTTSYFGSGQVEAVTDARGNRTTNTYDAADRLTSVTNARGAVNTTTYDVDGRVLATVDALGAATTSTYDSAGRLESVTNVLGFITTSTYLPGGLLQTTTDPGGCKSTFSYDCVGRQTAVTDGNGKTTTTVYDAAGRAIAVVNALGHRTTTTYDDASRPTELIDANGHITTSVYDAAGRRTQKIDPLGRSTSYDYDGVGNMTERTTPCAGAIVMQYDPVNQLIDEQFLDGMRNTFAYDCARRRTGFTDSTGSTAFAYDEVGNRTHSTNPDGKTISYVYDEVNSRTKMTDSDGGVTTYTRDLKERLTRLINPKNQVTSFQYDALDREILKQTANGVTASTVYDPAGNVSSVVNRKSTGEVISSHAYTYDCAGNKQTGTDASGIVTSWSYDATYQLTGEQKGGWYGYSTAYSYDPVGNRLEKTDSGETTVYSYDAANQLLSETSPCVGLTTYGYDSCGNTVQKNAPAGITYYGYDADNRMTSAEPPGGSVSFTYNADDQRVSKETICETTKFIWDFERLLAETDDSDNTERYYTSTTEEYGDLISEHNEFDDTAYPQYDAIGNAEALVDDNQTPFAQAQIRAFGLTQGDLAGTPFTFVGKQGYYRDLETELFYIRRNFYDPATGRWRKPDPLGERVDAKGNVYVYVGNNPTDKTDASGLQPNKDRRRPLTYFEWQRMSPRQRNSVRRDRKTFAEIPDEWRDAILKARLAAEKTPNHHDAYSERTVALVMQYQDSLMTDDDGFLPVDWKANSLDVGTWELISGLAMFDLGIDPLSLQVRKITQLSKLNQGESAIKQEGKASIVDFSVKRVREDQIDWLEKVRTSIKKDAKALAEFHEAIGLTKEGNPTVFAVTHPEQRSGGGAQFFLSLNETAPDTLRVTIQQGVDLDVTYRFAQIVAGQGARGRTDRDSAQIVVAWEFPDGTKKLVTNAISNKGTQEIREASADWTIVNDKYGGINRKGGYSRAFHDLEIPEGATKARILVVYTDLMDMPWDNEESDLHGDAVGVLASWSGEKTKDGWTFKNLFSEILRKEVSPEFGLNKTYGEAATANAKAILNALGFDIRERRNTEFNLNTGYDIILK